MKLNKKTQEYWEEKDILELKQAETMSHMFEVGLRVLKKIPQPVEQICGPISTGGKGSLLENLVAFNETIVSFQNEGKNIFDQMPFEEPMQRIKSGLQQGEYATTILTDFYLPIFESGLVKKLYFMKDWQSSKGSNWEHEQAKRLGIEIEYL